MDDLAYADIGDLAQRLRRGDLSSVELTRRQLERIGLLDGALKAYALVLETAALEQAAAADRELAAGRWRGPLHGVPLGVKDLLWLAGAPTAAGTIVHRGFRPAEDATIVRRLRAAGAVFLGKLQLTEGAYSDHHPDIDAPVNPWEPEAWTGISSSGAAVALSAGLCYGAIASDTGGSIRWPCAAAGLSGLKPTWGRVSRHGSFALAPSLDHFGPMARSVADVALLHQAIAGPDPADPTTLLEPPEAALDTAVRPVDGLRLGLDPRWCGEDVDEIVRRRLDEAVRVFRGLGAEIVEIAFPDVRQAIEDWALICAVEAAVAHEPTFPAREAEYGPVLSHVLRAGRAASALDLQRAMLRRMELAGRITGVLDLVDAALLPAQPFAPLSLADLQSLGVRAELVAKLQRYTCVFNMTGHPTLSLPGGLDPAGRPVGLQLVGRRLGEPTLLRAGLAFQGVTTHHRARPSGPAMARRTASAPA